MGGKTGTGDNRFKTVDAAGNVIESRAVDRTSTFAFFLGDRFFGTITAYVPGEDADKYSFTSALALQLLKGISPTVQRLIDTPEVREQIAVYGREPIQEARAIVRCRVCRAQRRSASNAKHKKGPRPATRPFSRLS